MVLQLNAGEAEVIAEPAPPVVTAPAH